jgi:hypothetical protein
MRAALSERLQTRKIIKTPPALTDRRGNCLEEKYGKKSKKNRRNE